jgi:NAD(P)H-flavin reductase
MTSKGVTAAVFRITEKKALAPVITLFRIEAPHIARRRKAGNFVILRATETGERIPITIADADPDTGTITLIIQEVGKTTALISRLEAGDHFLDVVGPLGHPTPVGYLGRVVCIGGGVGAAEVFPIAAALKNAGNDVVGITGARSRELVILEREMRNMCSELLITTDDGSYGMKGFVTDALGELLERSAPIDGVYAIGPIPMMRAVAELTRAKGIRTYVSMNPLMMDGTGMCGACRVTVGGKMKFACVDGPEFDAHAVDFDELIARNRTYEDAERMAYESYLNETEKV